MVTVAIVGATAYGARLCGLSADYASRSEQFALMEAIFKESPGIRHLTTQDKAALVEPFSALKQKYSHAARHPWLPVSPEPPEPE
jgi:hypothetical protein